MSRPAAMEDSTFIERYPLPIARAYDNFRQAHEVKEAHDRAFVVFEVVLKYLATAFIANYVSGTGRNHRVNAALKGLARPSLGEWAGFLRELILFHKGALGAGDQHLETLVSRLRTKVRRAEFCELHGALIALMENRPSAPSGIVPLNLFDLLVRYRNWGVGHGAPLARESYGPLVEKLTGALYALLETLDCLTELPLVFVKDHAEDGSPEVNGRAHPAMGCGSPLAAPPLQLPAAVIDDASPGSMHLYTGQRLEPWFPLTLFRDDDFYFLNSGLAEPRLRVEYLSYSTGDHTIPSGIEEAQRQLLGVILGYDITKEEFTRIATSLGDGPTMPADAGTGRTVLGDFVLLRELGRGGMGIVHQAYQQALGRIVALKVLPSDAGARTVARFERECRATARLHHPNIVPVYEVGKVSGVHYYSMALIEGPTLAQVIEQEKSRRKKIGSRRSRTAGTLTDLGVWLERIRDAARALDYAHELDMVHRDVKPSNLMLDPSGRLLVMDFGLVQDAAEAALTQSGERLGSLKYMSPEQILRQPVDRRTDVWSLGATLYELLTLQAPFEGENEFEIEGAITRDDPVLPRRLNRHLSPDLETIVLKALEKNQLHRYQTTGELAEDLERFLTYRPILAKPPGLLRRLGKTALRQRVATVGIAVAVLAAVLFGGVAAYRSNASYRRALLKAQRDTEAGRFEQARTGVSHLLDVHGNEPAVLALVGRLSAALRQAGLAQWNEFRAARTALDTLEEQWTDAVGEGEAWQPPWEPERDRELVAWKAYSHAAEGANDRYDQALALLLEAEEIAAVHPEALHAVRRALGDVYWNSYQEALREGGITFPSSFFKRRLHALGIEAYRDQLDGGGVVSIRTTPPGATVYCFRYEVYDEVMVPMAYAPRRGRRDPAQGLVGDPFLRIERVWNAGMCPFQEGDHLCSVKGEHLCLRRDLAAVLACVEADENVETEVVRAGERLRLAWTPFPAERYAHEPKGSPLRPGRTVSFREQFGFTFAGYPLALLKENRVGETGTDAPVRVELPSGSYLFVLRKNGYHDTRVPVTVPTRLNLETVALVRAEDVPADFVYIPAGETPIGGDRTAEQSLEAETAYVEGFLIGRHEVTIGQWLTFVNHPSVFPRITEDGLAPHVVSWSTEKLKDLRPDDTDKVQLIPLGPDGALLFQRSDGKWFPWARGNGPDAAWPIDWPALGVSMFAALEYAHWFTELNGNRWRYRLPTDREWEKAARGADQRFYVWGNYPLWSYCSGLKAQWGPGSPSPVGSYPIDESVYSVRDMAGSVFEVTTDRTDPDYRYTALRGGNWRTSNVRYFRVCTRNGRPPESSYMDTGFRLVAELPVH